MLQPVRETPSCRQRNSTNGTIIKLHMLHCRIANRENFLNQSHEFFTSLKMTSWGLLLLVKWAIVHAVTRLLACSFWYCNPTLLGWSSSITAATKLPTPDPPPQPPSPDLLGSPAFHHIAHDFKIYSIISKSTTHLLLQPPSRSRFLFNIIMNCKSFLELQVNIGTNPPQISTN